MISFFSSDNTRRHIMALRSLVCGIPVLMASSGAFSGAAQAEGLEWKPIADLRLRYENVDQTGLSKNADALTARLRAGFEVKSGDIAFLAEGEGTLPLQEHYNSTTNGKGIYPVVADPENAELNRLQIQYSGIANTVVTLGRQRINIDDQRFVGSVGWRQNEQTFDAVRVEVKQWGPIFADLTYSWSDRTIFGMDSAIQSIDGDNFFAVIGASLGPVTIKGYSYLIEQDETGRRQFSSQTYGVRADGKFPISAELKLALAASYARQSDWKDNPNNYAADYWLADASLDYNKLGVSLTYEVLGADSGAAFTSFQTPLATLHKFQGWADKFLTTPANGIQDLGGSVSYAPGKFELVGPVKLAVAYHDFKSDKGSINYGHEWNAQIIMTPRDDLKIIAKYADYTADKFGTDTRKFWFEVSYSL